MRTKVVRWGHSLGLRIPKTFAQEIGIAEGSEVDLCLENGRLVLQPADPDRDALAGLLEQVTDENRHDEIDTGDAVGGEAW